MFIHGPISSQILSFVLFCYLFFLRWQYSFLFHWEIWFTFDRIKFNNETEVFRLKDIYLKKTGNVMNGTLNVLLREFADFNFPLNSSLYVW